MKIHDSATATIRKSFVQLQVFDRKHLAVLLQLHPYFSLLPFAECRKILCGARGSITVNMDTCCKKTGAVCCR